MNLTTPSDGWVRIMQYEDTKPPAVLAPAASDLYGYVGQVAVAWGAFERDMSDFLESMLFVAGDDLRLAHRGPFRIRKKLFRERMAIVFATCPTVLGTLDRVMHEAADLQWRRNLLLHGVPTSGYADDGRAIIKQVGEHNGREVELTFDETALRSMLLRIAQMHGLLDAIGEEPEPPSLERQFVRAHLASAHPRCRQ